MGHLARIVALLLAVLVMSTGPALYAQMLHAAGIVGHACGEVPEAPASDEPASPRVPKRDCSPCHPVAGTHAPILLTNAVGLRAAPSFERERELRWRPPICPALDAAHPVRGPPASPLCRARSLA